MCRILSALWTLGIFGFGFAWIKTQLLVFGILALIFIAPLIIAIPFFFLTAPTTSEEYHKWEKGKEYQSLFGKRNGH